MTTAAPKSRPRSTRYELSTAIVLCVTALSSAASANPSPLQVPNPSTRFQREIVLLDQNGLNTFAEAVAGIVDTQLKNILKNNSGKGGLGKIDVHEKASDIRFETFTFNPTPDKLHFSFHWFVEDLLHQDFFGDCDSRLEILLSLHFGVSGDQVTLTVDPIPAPRLYDYGICPYKEAIDLLANYIPSVKELIEKPISDGFSVGAPAFTRLTYELEAFRSRARYAAEIRIDSIYVLNNKTLAALISFVVEPAALQSSDLEKGGRGGVVPGPTGGRCTEVCQENGLECIGASRPDGGPVSCWGGPAVPYQLQCLCH